MPRPGSTLTIAGTPVSAMVSSWTLAQELGEHDRLVVCIESPVAPVARDAVPAECLGKTYTLRRGEGDDACEHRGRIVGHRRLPGGAVILEGASSSYCLDGVSRSRCFGGNTPGEVIRHVLDSSGVEYECVLTAEGPKSICILQHVESDWDLLLREASEVDALVYSEGDRLVIRTEPAPIPAVHLAAHEVVTDSVILQHGLLPTAAEVRVMSYNPHQRAWLTARVDAAGQGATAATACAASDAAFPEAAVRLVHGTGPTEQWRESCRSQRNRAAAGMVTLGAVTASPEVRVGRVVRIGDDEQHWLVVATRVDSWRERELRCQFTAVPLELAAARLRIPPSHASIQLEAQVVDDADPDGLGRVAVELAGFDQRGPIWCRVLSAFAGVDHGSCILPHPGDAVMISFLGGPEGEPIVTGSLFHADARPPQSSDVAQEAVLFSAPGIDVRAAQKRGEQRVSINLGDGKLKVDLRGGDQPSLAIDCAGDLRIASAGRVVIAGKSVTLEATATSGQQSEDRLEIAVGSTSLQSGDVAFEAQRSAKYSATNVELFGSREAVVDGALIRIKRG